MLYFHSWSGGKDSTASIILDYMYGLPPSTIVFSEVMFDKKRGISGELPEHIDFIYNIAIPLFKSWGYTVYVLRAEKDYMDLFFNVIQSSKNHPERNGKYSGWLIGGMCAANNRLKIAPIKQFYKSLNVDFIQYVGIAIDEPIRLERLKNTNKISLLAKYNYTEQMAYDLCKQYNLLSPVYNFSKRGGCWFCPNKKISELAYLKLHHFDLWEELLYLDKVSNVASHGFKYGKTLSEVDNEINNYLELEFYKSLQLSLF